jgi:hypothetical protein
MHSKMNKTMTHKIATSLFLWTLMLILGCDNWITSYGPQPDYIDEWHYRPMLNVFGVLRPDTLGPLPQSFVHLEQAFPVTFYPDTLDVQDAEVVITRFEAGVPIDSVALEYTDMNAAFPRAEYRHSDFFPLARTTYGIVCRREGYPELVSETTTPAVPVLLESTFEYTQGHVYFSILRDSLAALYEIYFILDEQPVVQRVRRPESGDVEVVFEIEDSQAREALIIIYAYDLKLSEYMTYNVNFKFNTYRSDYSTVENGYGCFGSLNLLVKTISLAGD